MRIGAAPARGIILAGSRVTVEERRIEYAHLTIEIDRDNATATFTVEGPQNAAPRNVEEARSLGADFWPLAIARELEDAILHLRFNEEYCQDVDLPHARRLDDGEVA